MTSLQKQMIRFINIARQKPSYFIPLIQKQLKTFINDKQMPLNQQIIYQTNQGRKAWEQALMFLQSQKPLPILQQHQGLNLSASTHAQDLSKKGIFGHTGSDGSTFSQRILRFCKKGHGSMAQLIGADFNFQNRNHSQMTILGLLIDDGVPDRGHRKTIFNPTYKYLGCKTQLQGQKVITVFNITQNKLLLKGDFGTQTAPSTLGYRNSNTFKSPSKIYQKSNFDDNRFCQTDFNMKKPLTQQNQKPFLDKGLNTPSKQNVNSGKFTSPFSTPDKKKTQNQKNLQQSKYSGSRKLCQKKESTKIYYEQDAKVTQITTQLIYNDGTIQQKIDKHTVYL